MSILVISSSHFYHVHIPFIDICSGTQHHILRALVQISIELKTGGNQVGDVHETGHSVSDELQVRD